MEMFKNSVPQRRIGRDLDISSPTAHNIIKRFKGSGGTLVHKEQGRKPKLTNSALRSLRRHCIKNRHLFISNVTTWAQDYFGKPLSNTTTHSYIHKCQLKLYFAKRKPYVNRVQKRRWLLWAQRHLEWTIKQWKRVLWSDESVFQAFFGRNGRCVLQTKDENYHPDCYQQQVQKPGSVMVWGCISALVKGNLHLYDGTINAKMYLEILEQHLLPTRWHLFQRHPCILQQDNAEPHYKGMAAEEEGGGAGLRAVPTWPPKRICGTFWNAKCDNRDPARIKIEKSVYFEKTIQFIKSIIK